MIIRRYGRADGYAGYGLHMCNSTYVHIYRMYYVYRYGTPHGPCPAHADPSLPMLQGDRGLSKASR